MLKNAASAEKAEAKVEAKMKNVRSWLSLDLDLSLPRYRVTIGRSARKVSRLNSGTWPD
jgi:hypothetical protein